MLKQLVDEKQLEALSISNKSLIPLLTYSELDDINSAEQMEALQKKAIRYFGKLGLVKVTTDKLFLDQSLLELLESSKTNEKFYVFEQYKHSKLFKQWCFYPTENYVGVVKKQDQLELTSTEDLEDLVHEMLSETIGLKSFPKDLEVKIDKEKYLEWMAAISSQNVEKAVEILLTLNVDEETATIIADIFISKENYLTLSLYNEEDLKAKLMVMASEYPVVIHFDDELDLSLSIISASYEDLHSYFKDFVVYSMTEMEDEVNG